MPTLRGSLLCLWLTLGLRLGTAQQITTAIIEAPPPPAVTEEEVEEGGRHRPERVEVVSHSDWKLFYKGNVTVEPNQPVTLFTIPVPKSADSRLPARFNISMVIPNPPLGCDPNVTIWYSPAVYYEELCMERDWYGECTVPGKEGFTSPEELIERYGSFKRVLFDYEWNRRRSWEIRERSREEIRERTTIRKALKGVFCHDDRDYWLAFSTSCYNSTYIDIEVGIKDMKLLDEWTCRGMDYFIMAQQGSDAFYTSRIFWAIIVPIGYFILLFVVIFGCGYIFNCGAQGRVTMLLKLDLNFDFDDSDDSGKEGPSSPHHKKH